MLLQESQRLELLEDWNVPPEEKEWAGQMVQGIRKISALQEYRAEIPAAFCWPPKPLTVFYLS